MRKVKTHWEVRRPKYHQGREPDEAEEYGSEAEARANAQLIALKGKGDCYTGEVKLVEVETHEEVLDTMDQRSVQQRLTPPRAAAMGDD